MTKLLNIDANAKTVKGQKQGYMTAVMYLAPYKAAGINVCPMAELAGCWKGCLNTAGRGGIAKDRATFDTPAGALPDNAIQRARIKRTRLYADDRDAFMLQLAKEIRAFVLKAGRKGLTPVVRLNGTSDIQWELQPAVDGDKVYANIFAMFPDIQFYDYTKIAKRFGRELPTNYALSLSYSEASERYRSIAMKAYRDYDASLVVVVRDKAAKAKYLEQAGDDGVDGDATDLRFLDAPGSLVYLKAKGSARQDQSGFVID